MAVVTSAPQGFPSGAYIPAFQITGKISSTLLWVREMLLCLPWEAGIPILGSRAGVILGNKK